MAKETLKIKLRILRYGDYHGLPGLAQFITRPLIRGRSEGQNQRRYEDMTMEAEGERKMETET